MQGSLIFSFVIVALACSHFVEGWHWQVPVDPEHPRMCHDTLTGKYYKLGDTWRRPQHCEGLRCGGGTGVSRHFQRNSYMTIHGEQCSKAVEVPENCHIKTSKEKSDLPYPECCPEIECDGEPHGPISMVH